MATPVQTRDQVVERLLGAEGALRRLGVERLALFGSFQRNESGPESDVDFLLDFVPGGKTYSRFISICHLLEELLDRRVEVLTSEALSPYLGPHIRKEAVDVLRAP